MYVVNSSFTYVNKKMMDFPKYVGKPMHGIKMGLYGNGNTAHIYLLHFMRVGPCANFRPGGVLFQSQLRPKNGYQVRASDILRSPRCRPGFNYCGT